MLPPEHGIPRPIEKLSVGEQIRRIDPAHRLSSDELLRILQRHAARGTPVVVLAGSARAVRPAVVVHRQGVVQFGPLVFRTGADEVNAIVHLTG